MSEHSTQLAIMITCPPETMEKMVGESIFDYKGIPIGWIANDVRRPDEPEEVDTLKLHERMNAALLDMNDELLALHTQDRENASSKKLIDCVIAAHQIIEDAATVGVGTCTIVKTWTDSDYADHWHYSCSECGYRIEVGERDVATGNPTSHANFCWNCGRRCIGIKEVTE